MKVILTEGQYNKLILEFYDRDKLYSRERIVNSLKSATKNIKQYIKKLPHIDVTDDQGNKKVLTKIPEVLYQYLHGNF
jgi:predicted HTH transcriptional regulator